MDLKFKPQKIRNLPKVAIKKSIELIVYALCVQFKSCINYIATCKTIGIRHVQRYLTRRKQCSIVLYLSQTTVMN